MGKKQENAPRPAKENPTRDRLRAKVQQRAEQTNLQQKEQESGVYKAGGRAETLQEVEFRQFLAEQVVRAMDRGEEDAAQMWATLSAARSRGPEDWAEAFELCSLMGAETWTTEEWVAHGCP